ncbi:MAG: DUF362 domain-containing protein [Bacillota bacterium]|uniref:Ferredoxin n=2 Tax=Carboxydocella TaxID=178898 RepID=A0A1T4QS11_9FIRM|nr:MULTISPECIES: DUF362 domain-containing protein [Carboxydocella]AVX20824.1 hypothetical protein CFE_1649 [Carboxydocella thermautotrophica]AVX31243.1 hypothetical protein CTH_1667 [Carboxydocella thermautotrophica]SKA06569.1 hypothetical protein SAMN02745885_01782 [Carboxydocella sporoproducens DSM 16521]GAW30006.1 4Fe-4S ferredoxin [Carboxydocella sp. ULO1]GAW32079.1 4Fe-4S ferredoxin [Carboxydocella sp. JDF658]
MAAKVYYTSMRTKRGESLLAKLVRLYKRAGFEEIISPGDLVAIKVHFGEKGNTAYIRPQFIRQVVEQVKLAGGKPFLTDANTLYRGSRANAVDHLITAIENGFDYAVVGAPLIIADGLTGHDYIKVPVNLKHFQEVKIGAAAVHADAFIAVSHFKGHEATGFGGTIKNIGMGLGSRSGKQNMHSDLLPRVNREKCIKCGRCIKWCPADAIAFAGEEGTALISETRCIGCGECVTVCPVQAIAINWKTEADMLQEKMVEYTYGVLKDKVGKCGFISFVTSVSPDCDCCGWSDAPLVADLGILASKDPVALDQACVDLVNQAPVNRISVLGDKQVEDKFRALYPKVDWSVQLRYGEEIGLGTRQYELIEV